MKNIDDEVLSAGTFQKRIWKEMGLVDHNQESDYSVFARPDGGTFSIRRSNNNAHAKNYKGKSNRAVDNYSIVISIPTSNDVTFRAQDGVNVREFVYKNPSAEQLQLLAIAIRDLSPIHINGEEIDEALANELYDSIGKVTNAKFYEFDINKSRKNNELGTGFYFTDDELVATRCTDPE